MDVVYEGTGISGVIDYVTRRSRIQVGKSRDRTGSTSDPTESMTAMLFSLGLGTSCRTETGLIN